MCTALGTLGRSAVDCAVATSAEVVRLLRQAKKNQWPARDKVMFPFATPHHKENSPDWAAMKAAGWRHCQFTFKSGKKEGQKYNKLVMPNNTQWKKGFEAAVEKFKEDDGKQSNSLVRRGEQPCKEEPAPASTRVLLHAYSADFNKGMFSCIQGSVDTSFTSENSSKVVYISVVSFRRSSRTCCRRAVLLFFTRTSAVEHIGHITSRHEV